MSTAPVSPRSTRRFDVHAHAVPAPSGPAAEAAARALMSAEGFTGSIPGAGWSVETALAQMDRLGTDLQTLSVPGALPADAARAANDRIAAVVAARPDRFGLLASLPLGDPDRAVGEIRRAADELGADGFAIPTNHDGVYLGDPSLDPIWAELDRYGLPVLVHPARPPGFERLGLGRPAPLLEYPLDMARTIVDAAFAGVLTRHPRVRLVLAHAGGALPALHDRIELIGAAPWTANPLGLSATALHEQLAAVYLDTALAGGPAALGPALDLVGPDHLVFGTDYPPASPAEVDRVVAETERTLGEVAERLPATFARLFPRAAARATGAASGVTR